MNEQEYRYNLKQLVYDLEAIIVKGLHGMDDAVDQCDFAYAKGVVNGLNTAKVRIEKMFELEDE